MINYNNQAVISKKSVLDTERSNDLIRRIQAREVGWRQALEPLVKMHQDWIYARCYSNLSHHHDAQEVMQEAILRMTRGIHNFGWRSSFRTWLTIIIDNQCKVRYAQRTRDKQVHHFEELILIHEQMLRRDQHRPQMDGEVNAIMDRLSQSAKEILRLRFYQDLSLEEIAIRLDISLSATKMRLYRSLNQFKVNWEEHVTPGIAD